MLFRREPARILAVVGAALALAVGFGLKISGQQVNLINVFVQALIPLLVGEATRANVVSPDTADKQIRTALTMSPAGPKPSAADVEEVRVATEAKKETAE